MTRASAFLVSALLLAVVGPLAAATAAYGDPSPVISDSMIGASETANNVDAGTRKGGGTSAPALDGSDTAPSASAESVKVKGKSKKEKVRVKTEACTDMSLSQCTNSRAGCITASGNPNYYETPTVTWVSVDDGPWQYSGLSCGAPESVTLPGGGAGGTAGTIAVEPPPVPTFAEIQQAFRELPFSKPSASIQPVGQKTLKNLPTYYAADWPENSGLQPGEVSKKIQLLSWTVEFKVAAKDYRYDYGDGETSRWTASTGGAYPEGDITHTYEDEGTVDVSVDARLTGQYRVNGGEWMDIATTADLQDEPTSSLEVLATKTRLVDN